MNETRVPDKDLIKKEYLEGVKQKDICSKYDISINTLKSWIKRYGWSKEKKGAPKKQKEYTRKDNKKNSVKKPSFDEVELIIQNDELTEKQRLFCIYYIENFNATKAYQRAYDCDYQTANANGSRMLVNASIKTEIDRLTKECLQEQEINSKLLNKRLFQKYMDIAFSDITDYISFGKKELEGEFGPYTANYIDLKDSTEVDGTLISEISEGKDGIKIKLADKMKALDWLDKHIGLASEEQRLKIDKLQAELSKITDNEDKNLTITIHRAGEKDES